MKGKGAVLFYDEADQGGTEDDKARIDHETSTMENDLRLEGGRRRRVGLGADHGTDEADGTGHRGRWR